MPTRRVFLRDSAMAMIGVGAAPAWLARTAYAMDGGTGGSRTLVVIFLRGAADGLNTVVPYFETNYFDLRPTIAIPRPGAANGAIDLDGRFGLHPSLAALDDSYRAKQLAIVHAAGSPDPTRSHFDAQDFMESGTPGLKATPDGWLNRALPAGLVDESSVRAIAMGKRLPRTLRGANAAIALDDISDFRLKGPNAAAFETMYSRSLDTELTGVARDTFEASRLLQSIGRQSYSPANGARYPQGRLGPSLEQIAQLVKAKVGVKVAFADMGGWDHHTNEAQQLASQLQHLGDSLAGFQRDLGDRMEDVVVVTMSEFGRSAAENGNLGTDHGHGNFMFVLGGRVKGGQVYGPWPGLAGHDLYEGRDLAVTTDFRDVLSELLAVHLVSTDLQHVFPGHNPATSLGLL